MNQQSTQGKFTTTRKSIAISAFIVSAMLFMPAMAFAKGSVIGYAAGWKPAPTAEQLDRVTHVMVFQLRLNADGTLKTSDVPAWLDDFVTAAHTKNVMVSIAVGGGGASENFATVTGNNTLRSTLVTQMKNYVTQHNLDGVDIDWEFPKGNTEWRQCMSLLEDLKAAMPCQRISIAIGGDSPNGQYDNHFDCPDKTIVQQRIWVADAIHLMTYDMMGVTGWATHADVNGSKNCIHNWTTFGTGQIGFSKEKLLMGCAFYANQGTNGDNAATVGEKVDYCYDNGYGGVLIWELSLDLPNSTLLPAIWNANTTKGGYDIITVNTQPTALTTVTQDSISESLSVAASTVSCADAPLSYQWYSSTTNSDTDGTLLSGMTNATFAIPASLTVGNYYYFCEIKSGKSTTRSNVATVTVNAAPNLGIALIQTASVQVYPNPVTTELHVKLAANGVTDYTICNDAGQIVLQGKLQDTSTINLQSLPNGIYYLRISGETVKVIKKS